MLKYVMQRIAFAILAFFVISILCFLLVSAFGPDPIKKLASQEFQSSQQSSHQTLAQIQARLEVQYGFRWGTEDNPGPLIPHLIRYFRYIGNILTKGDFNFLINNNSNPNKFEYTDIWKLFFNPLRYSVLVSAPAFIMSAVFGTTLGVVAGYKRGKWADSTINVFVLFFIALPSFIIAPIAISISVKLKILSTIPPFGSGQSFGRVFAAYLPPIIVVTLGSLAVYTTYARNQVITVLTSNYVLIAKTKGLSQKQIFFKYVLRNISIPLFAIVFPSFLFLLSGSIIIEKYWDIPGTSQTIAFAFPEGEIFIVMFSTQFFSLLSLFSELVVDVMYVILDPRITYGTKSKKNFSIIFKTYLQRKKVIKDLRQSLLEQYKQNLLNKDYKQQLPEDQVSIGGEV
ncbi:ABC transporter permease [Metamycoplasma hyosynoviae]|uniref:Oligopeptide transport system permease protein n=2 Tax=Metamycoplasma hyosynoviae TaxID=29559 RepID=A0A4R7TYP3_9BACT|nr:ABC transporter permease [Metamycoplasma hyosynoviae]MDC8900814.1 ABC transporter permease [Metamycoplasma hyosynoviae]MDC8912329.1 ABC transporter permease [Metamycoplasma hyosynoviae]MDC8913024.1 ABC transporter permease [Metamycoplasma hyosynoviae]MDC8914486.1 ABC transporter permease [Metamycoplasma hyosynoviae]MDC8914787.1 ABC transporter permease [Metamycoplasma hyosynoviae]